MRRLITTVVFACAVGLVVPSLWNPVEASSRPFDRLSYMTFSQSVTLPGVTLPAGEYIFRLPDRNTARMVLQVLSKDRQHVYAMLLTRPTLRTDVTEDPMVTFHESPEGTVPPIRAWFYADEKFGLEFAYTEEQAKLIAQHSSHPVLTTSFTYVEPIV